MAQFSVSFKIGLGMPDDQAEKSADAEHPSASVVAGQRLDVILQMAHQSHAYKLVEYHRAHAAARVGMRVFDDLCAGEAAVELPPRTNKKGRCLVLLRQPRASPTEFVSWLAENPILNRRVFRTYHVFPQPSQRVATVDALSKAIVSASVPQPVRLQFAPPIPGHEDVKGDLVRVLIEAGVALSPQDYASVVHIVPLLKEDTGAEIDNSGASTPKSPKPKKHSVQSVEFAWGWVNREGHWTIRTDTKISDGHSAKAMAKLAEAVYTSNVKLHVDHDDVVDLGAAPGSWSSWLSSRVRRVIAVDPGALDARVLELPNVIHVAKKVEELDAVADIPAPPFKPTLLVCDINAHPTDVARMCLPILHPMAPGSRIVVTLKFFGTGRDRTDAISEVAEVFGDLVVDVTCLWLFANTIYERVLIATKR